MPHRYSTGLQQCCKTSGTFYVPPFFRSLRVHNGISKICLIRLVFIYIFFSEKALSPLSQFYLENKKSIENDIPHFSKTIVRVNYMYIII